MARHVPSLPRRHRAASVVLVGAAALGAVALVPGAASAAPVPTATTVPAKADLSVTIDSSSTAIEANGAAAIEVTVTNNGTADADRVRTLVTLPPGIVAYNGFGPVVEQNATGTAYRFDEATPLAAGQSRTYGLLVGSSRARASSGTAQASTRSTTLDPALRNNTARTALRAAGGPPAF